MQVKFSGIALTDMKLKQLTVEIDNECHMQHSGQWEDLAQQSQMQELVGDLQ